MLIRSFAALMMMLMVGLAQGGPVDAAMHSGNLALGGLVPVAAGALDQDRHEHPTRTGGAGNCHHASVPCVPSFLYQHNSVLEYVGSSHSWTLPDSADLKPIALKRDPPIPRPVR